MIRPGDIAVLALALGVVGAGWGRVLFDTTQATMATVRSVEGGTREIALSRDATIEVAGRRGTSRIRVEEGRARFVASACTRDVCIRQGWLSDAGAVAACAPNGVTLRLAGTSRRFDTVNF